MGGTLPAMVRHTTGHLELVGRRISVFYGVNAAGSVVGSLAMAFVCLPLLGKTSSLMVLALLNLLVAVGAIALAREPASKVPSEQHSEAVETVCDPRPPVPSWVARTALAAAFAAGFVSFAYEIAWTRVFGVILGSSTYSFAIMLAAFISGIAAGSMILARLDHRVTDPLRLFGWAQILVAALVIAPLSLYPQLPQLLSTLARLLSTELAAFYLYSLCAFAVCFAIMFPPTLLIGTSLPLLVKGLAETLGSLGRDTGRVYAWNTFGNVFGALLAGLALLPMLGMERLLELSALGNAAVALVVLFVLPGAVRRPRARLVPVVVIVVLCLAAATRERWNPAAFTGQVFRRHPEAFRRAQVERTEVLFVRDDPAGHVMVGNTPEREPQVALWIGGKADATSRSDMPTQVLSGHIPLLLHPDPRDVLIVGLASGVTAGAALTHDVDQVHVVEILQAMMEASSYFEPWNRDPASDDRFRLIVDDARSYLLHTPQQYDVVISEPSNPWVAGCAALFTTDFYEIVQRKLRPGGIFLQWVQAYEISDDTFLTTIRTVRSAFPHVYGFQGASNDILLCASLTPFEPDWERLAAVMGRPQVRRQLAEVGVHDLDALLMLQRYSPATVDLLASMTGRVNTDDNLFLEYRAPRDLFQRLRPDLADDVDERLDLAPSLLWAERRRSHGATGVPALYRLYTDERYAIPRLLEVVRTVELSRGYGLDLGLPGEWIARPPLPPEDIVTRVSRLLEYENSAAAARLISRYRHFIVHTCAQSEPDAARWSRTIEQWRRAARPSPRVAEFRQLWIEIQAVRNRLAPAAGDLRRWTRSSSPPPWDWATLQTCRLDRDTLCRDVVETYLARQPNDTLRRMAELRWGSP
jgi:spermidine synthase